MSSNHRIMNANELLSMPDNGNRCELVHGELQMMSPAGGRHGRITLKLARRIGDFVERHSLGMTYAAETGFVIRRNPDTVRAPDVAFVAQNRISGYADHSGYIPLVPDLVAEIMSPNDNWSDVIAKATDWIDCGAAIVLIVDPQRTVIHEYRPPNECRLHSQGVIDLAPILPGFKLEIHDVFSY